MSSQTELAGVIEQANGNAATDVTITLTKTDTETDVLTRTVDSAYLFELSDTGTYDVVADSEAGTTTKTVTVYEGENTVTNLTLPTADSTLPDYANNKGIIDIDGLRTAIDDFINDDISVTLLRDVIDAFINETRVTE